MTDLTLDQDRQRLAKQYSRISRRLMLFELLLGGLYALAWLVFGWSSALAATLSSVTNNEWLLVALFAGVFAGIYVLLTLPFSYYDGFVLPHRFGLSTQTLSEWVIDLLKGGLIVGLFGLLIIEVIYAILRTAPQTWWLWVGLVLLFFTVILANIAPVLLFPIFNKFHPLGDEHADLVARLIRLADRAHTHVEGVFQFDMSRRSTTANAALTGLGKTRRIIVGDTMLENYSADEIETILAHELGHHLHHDIPVGILVQGLLTMGGLYLASIVLSWGSIALGFDGPADIAALPLLILILGAYELVTMPLSNAYSRWRERQADLYALEATQMGSAYASALTKLADQNLINADPEPWMEFIFSSHPALSKRISTAKSFQPE